MKTCTANERGFPDWIGMIEALTPEQRARLVSRLNAANLDLAAELHGRVDEDGSPEAGPADTEQNGPGGAATAGAIPSGE